MDPALIALVLSVRVASPVAESEPVSTVGRRALLRLPPPATPGLGSFEITDHLGCRVLDDRFGIGEDPLDIIRCCVGFALDGRTREWLGDKSSVDHGQLKVRAPIGASPRLLRRQAERAEPSNLTVIVGTTLEMAAVLTHRHVPSLP